jgi:hypothetical protein
MVPLDLDPKKHTDPARNAGTYKLFFIKKSQTVEIMVFLTIFA